MGQLRGAVTGSYLRLPCGYWCLLGSLLVIAGGSSWGRLLGALLGSGYWQLLAVTRPLLVATEAVTGG